LEIGRQVRPALYALEPQRPAPLVPRARRVGVRERVLADGTVETPLRPREVARALAVVARSRATAVAVCLLHGYARPAHERRLGRALAGRGLHVTLSHRLLREYREYERMATTALNAYVGPLMARHLRALAAVVPGRRLRVMQSGGGLIGAPVACAEPVRTILSGPAGGVVGAAERARRAGHRRVITLDMGGTSADVSLVDGALAYRSETSIDGLPVRVPAIDIHTVGAGGGSLARLDRGGALRVGPESAGADPGPACYGRGSAPTVTDANLVLGRLVETEFLGGAMRLDRARAERAIAPLARRLGRSVEATAAEVVRDYGRTLRVVAPPEGVLGAGFRALVRAAARDLEREGVRPATVERLLEVRYAGQAYEVSVPYRAGWERAFHRAHARLFGHADPRRPVEVVTLRARARGGGARLPTERPPRAGRPAPLAMRPVAFAEGARRAAVHRRDDLGPGRRLRGPAVICEYSATTLVPPGWRVFVDRLGGLLLEV